MRPGMLKAVLALAAALLASPALADTLIHNANGIQVGCFYYGDNVIRPGNSIHRFYRLQHLKSIDDIFCFTYRRLNEHKSFDSH